MIEWKTTAVTSRMLCRHANITNLSYGNITFSFFSYVSSGDGSFGCLKGRSTILVQTFFSFSFFLLSEMSRQILDGFV